MAESIATKSSGVIGQTHFGRSPEGDDIHRQYLEYHTEIDKHIHDLDSLPYEQRNQSNVQQARLQLIELQKKLHSKFESNYNNSQATLVSFKDDCAEIKSKAQFIINQATGQGASSIHEAIEQKYLMAQDIVATLNQQILQDQQLIGQLQLEQADLLVLLVALQEEIEALPNHDPRKAKAISHFKTANQVFRQVKQSIATAQQLLENLQNDMARFTASGGIVDVLKELVDLKDPTQSNLDQAGEALAQLKSPQNQQTTLEATLATANRDIASLKVAIQITQEDLLPLPTLHDEILKNYQNAQATTTALIEQIKQDESLINQLLQQQSNLKTTAAELQKQIDALESGDPRKVKAQASLNSANQSLALLNGQIVVLHSQLDNLQNMLKAITEQKGILNTLQLLANKQDPDQSDLDASQAALQQIAAAKTFEQTTLQASLLATQNNVQSVSKAIQKVQSDLSPAGKIEHATWYITWTSWDYPIPEAVNTVNIFVGNMHLDAKGDLVIDGFGTLNAAKMKAFIQGCHEKGIKVKISIGGGGGAYDNCWDILTKENVSKCARILVDFCHQNELDGVDFDIEKFKSAEDNAEQQKLCGRFIQEFKALDPTLSTSLCTNAGFGPYFPWQGIVKSIFDAASTLDPISGQKICAVDRLYIMSYYNSLEDEKKWILGWYEWLKTNYHYTASQVTVGIDDKDAHAYDIRDMAAFAAEYGFSESYWEFDPARAADSNQSTHAIEDAYNAHSHVLPFIPV